MAITSKAALFFLLATFALAKYEAEISALVQRRHPALAPISDFSLTVEQAKQKIADELNAVLLFSPGQDTPNFWQDLMADPSSNEYKFQAGEEDLNEQTLLTRVGQTIDAAFPAVDALSGDNEAALTQAYFAGMDQVYAKLERLLKLELVTQFTRIIRSRGRGKLQFLGNVFAQVQDKVTAKANQLITGRQIRPTAALEEVKARLSKLESGLRSDFFPRIEKVADLYLNAMVYFNIELQLVILLTQESTAAKNDRIVSKFEFALTSLAELAMLAQDPSIILDLYPKFNAYIIASRAGSSLGSARFKELVPSIIGIFVRVIGTHFGHDQGYAMARKCLKGISGMSSNKDISAWFESYVLEADNLPSVGDPESADFKVNAMKTLDILYNVEYTKNLLMWWMQAQKSLVDILEVVSGDTLNQMNLYKLITSNDMLKYADQPEYFRGIYDLLVRFVAEKGSNAGDRKTWYMKFLDYANAHFADNLTVKRYYMWIKVHLLAYRTSDEGETQFVEFVKGNEANFDYFKTWAAGLDAIARINFLEELKTAHKNAGGKNTKANNQALVYVSYFSGKSLPVAAFARVKTQENISENEVRDNQGELQKRTIETEIKEGQAHEGLKDLDKKKVDAPVKEKTPVKQPEIQQPEVQSEIQEPELKEKTPVRDQPHPQISQVDPLLVGPVEVVNEREPTPVKQKEPTPIKEQQPSPIKEKEPTPIKEADLIEGHPAIKTPAKQLDDGTPQKSPNKIQPVTEDLREEPVLIQQTPEKRQDEQQEQPQQLQDVQEEEIPATVEVKTPELENLIDVVKGSLDPATVEALRKNPDLVDLVEKMQIVVHENGDETHYHYIQVVPKDSACYDSISE